MDRTNGLWGQFSLVFLIVAAYASYLAFQVRGAPDQTMIQTFAVNHYGPDHRRRLARRQTQREDVKDKANDQQ